MNGFLQRTDQDHLPKASLYALVAANMFPLLGVVFLGWRVGDIMLLFWMENVIIGGFNVLRMGISAGRGVLGFLMNLPMIAFFTVHYGGFTFIHGIFVVILFVGVEFSDEVFEQPPVERPVIEITEDPDTWPDAFRDEMTDEEFDAMLEALAGVLYDRVIGAGLWVGILALIISHAVSLRTNFIGNGEYRNVKADDLMLRPYGRIVVLHLVIIVGGMLVMMTGQFVAALVLLVLLKIAIDLVAHLHERKRLGRSSGAAA